MAKSKMLDKLTAKMRSEDTEADIVEEAAAAGAVDDPGESQSDAYGDLFDDEWSDDDDWGEQDPIVVTDTLETETTAVLDPLPIAEKAVDAWDDGWTDDEDVFGADAAYAAGPDAPVTDAEGEREAQPELRDDDIIIDEWTDTEELDGEAAVEANDTDADPFGEDDLDFMDDDMTPVEETVDAVSNAPASALGGVALPQEMGVQWAPLAIGDPADTAVADEELQDALRAVSRVKDAIKSSEMPEASVLVFDDIMIYDYGMTTTVSNDEAEGELADDAVFEDDGLALADDLTGAEAVGMADPGLDGIGAEGGVADAAADDPFEDEDDPFADAAGIQELESLDMDGVELTPLTDEEAAKVSEVEELMASPGMESIIDIIDGKGAFAPQVAEQAGPDVAFASDDEGPFAEDASDGFEDAVGDEPATASSGHDMLAEAMLVDIDDVDAAGSGVVASIISPGNIAEDESEEVYGEEHVEYYQQDIDRKLVDELFPEAADIPVAMPAKSGIGESEIIEVSEAAPVGGEDMVVAKDTVPMDDDAESPAIARETAFVQTAQSAEETPAAADGIAPVQQAPEPVSVSGLTPIHDREGVEIRMHDVMAYENRHTQLGEVIGIGEGCFFTRRTDELDADGCAIVDQWFVEEGDRNQFYHFAPDSLESVIEDLMDPDIPIEDLAGRFRKIARQMRLEAKINN